MKFLHETVTRSARLAPKKKALVYKDQSLTYGGLDQISSRLAALLVENGVCTGDRIGIYMDKSIDAFIALFGILKTGACYVPLDPLAPPSRLSLIANNCGLKFLVTTSNKHRQVTSIASQSKALKHVVVLDKHRNDNTTDIPGIAMNFRDDVEKSPLHSSSAPGQLTQGSLAYILYTSGSTGQPKGVMVSHRAALAFVDWSLRAFAIEGEDILSSHAPLHFDLSIFDIFVSMKAGARVCIVPQGWSAFPRTMTEFIQEQNLTTWYSVPSALVQLVLHGKLDKRQFPALKRILFAGEVFPSKYLRELMERIPHAEYYNLYGPTETNVITYYHVQSPPDAEATIPIGSVCDGVRSFVVSNSGALAVRGEIGELCVESPTLMDGYWHDPKKTQTVMQNNPFEPSTKTLLYKTGDLVSFNEKGALLYHGRSDAMIKSRGYRIELGEIEAALSSHSGLKEVAVAAVPDDEIGSRIKAVIVPDSGEPVSKKEILRFCSQNLPAYMVPEFVSFVPALPRTSTGKIDRQKCIHLEG